MKSLELYLFFESVKDGKFLYLQTIQNSSFLIYERGSFSQDFDNVNTFLQTEVGVRIVYYQHNLVKPISQHER